MKRCKYEEDKKKKGRRVKEVSVKTGRREGESVQTKEREETEKGKKRSQVNL